MIEQEKNIPDIFPYEYIDCLKMDGDNFTYLYQNRQNGEKVLVKIGNSDENSWQFRNEYELLNIINQSGDPLAEKFTRPVKYSLNDENMDQVVFIRQFIPGMSLESVVESQPDKPGLSAGKAVDYTISILKKLAFLHHFLPPIIHRDIKPQNIIVNENDECFLIDLGISRIFHENVDSDTRIAGTRAIAPPEQFGFKQTDARSDIYSVGVLLRYCLTGDYRDRENNSGIDRKLQKIIRKATRFDPDERYQCAEDMISDLEKYLRNQNDPSSSLGEKLKKIFCLRN